MIEHLPNFYFHLAQVNWDNLFYPASVLLAELTEDKNFDTKVQAFLQKWVCRSVSIFIFWHIPRASASGSKASITHPLMTSPSYHQHNTHAVYSLQNSMGTFTIGGAKSAVDV